MKKEATTEEEQKDTSIFDLYDKLEEIKAKHAYITVSVARNLEEANYSDEVISGFQFMMNSHEDDFKKMETMLDKVLDRRRFFESAEARILMVERGGFTKRETAIKHLNEDIEEIKRFLAYANEAKEKAEGLLKKGENLLQRYQAA